VIALTVLTKSTPIDHRCIIFLDLLSIYLHMVNGLQVSQKGSLTSVNKIDPFHSQ